MGVRHSTRFHAGFRSNSRSTGSRSLTSSKGEPNFEWKQFWEDGDIRELMPQSITVLEVGKLFLSCYKVVFNGKFKAPVRLENGGKVLEVGCSHGLWATEVALDYPKAEIIGVDYNDTFLVEADRKRRPSNFKFIQTNYTEILPFPDEAFDFVFYRPIATDVVRGFWSKILSELIRVTKPGGYMELLVGDFHLGNTGPLTGAMIRELAKIMAKQGADSRLIRRLGPLLESQRNLVFVQATHSSMPVGWGGPVGEATKVLVESLFPAFVNLTADALGLAPENIQDYISRCVNECSEYRTYYNAYTAYARRSQFS